jgi:hypothetical protein
VKFAAGAPVPGEADRVRLTTEGLRNGWRLACQAVLTSEAAIERPEVSRSPVLKSFGDAVLVPADRVPIAASGTP